MARDANPPHMLSHLILVPAHTVTFFHGPSTVHEHLHVHVGVRMYAHVTSQVALRGRPSWLLLLDGGGLVYLIRILSRCISHNGPPRNDSELMPVC